MVQDFIALAATRTRDQFVAGFPHPFLVGEGMLREARSGARTFESGRTVSADEQKLARAGRVGQLVLPVCKNQSTFPSMITIGRTKNNDVVVPDVLISKLHAFFRLVGGRHELADAGSQNGTRVGDTLLPPKGPGVRVRSGDVVCFAQLRFRFLDAAACWEALRAH
jgi:hypothetical protein